MEPPELVSVGKGEVAERVPFFRRVGKFFLNWASEMSLLILTVASIMGAAGLSYLITGRAPQESMGWLMDYASRCVLIALAITFTSASRQAFGHWFTESQLLDRPWILLIQSVKSLAIFALCLWVLSH